MMTVPLLVERAHFILLTTTFLLSSLCGAQHQHQYQPYQNNLLYGRLETDVATEVIEDDNNNNINKPLLQCYDCNSEFDPRCGDPFNPYTIGIINCTDRKVPNHLLDPDNPNVDVPPVLCRKMTQKVEGHVRVIRGCGYIRDDHDDKKCYRRTGTANVEVIHCSCTTSLCNTANSIRYNNNKHNIIKGGIILTILALTNSILQ